MISRQAVSHILEVLVRAVLTMKLAAVLALAGSAAAFAPVSLPKVGSCEAVKTPGSLL